MRRPQPQTADPAHVPPSDADLMEEIVAGDQRALMKIYQRYGNAIYSMAFRTLGDGGLAEEVTQDTFLKLWRRAEQWDQSKGRLSTWLLTVARNGAIDRLRQESRRPHQLPGSFQDHEHLLTSPSPVDEPFWHDGQLLRSLLGQIPGEQAQLIEMAFFQGYTHSQLAEALELPLGTVKTRLRLGLKKLKELWVEATEQKDG